MKHRLASEEFVDAYSVEATYEHAVIVEGFHTVGPTHLVQLGVLVDESWGNPHVVFVLTRGTAEHHSLEARIYTNVITPRTTAH